MTRIGIKLLAVLTLIELMSGPAEAGADKPLVIVGAQTRQLPSGDTLQTNASAAGGASINMPHGAAPTSPNNGDCWTTTSGLFCRINGSTVGPYSTGVGSGSVTSVSVASANGFAGSVANATSTPSITLSTSATGLLKGNGTAISAASAGTDYVAPDSELTALAGVTSAADKCPYFTGSGTASVFTCGSSGRSLISNGYQLENFCVAVSDETTAITTGTSKVTWRMPYAFTVTAVRASLNTVSSSGNPAFDVNEGGVSIFSTTLTIDASEKTSVTAATAAVISDSSLADDAEMTVDIDTAGTGAKGAKICLIGHQ